jgi:hypothetical protein
MSRSSSLYIPILRRFRRELVAGAKDKIEILADPEWAQLP